MIEKFAVPNPTWGGDIIKDGKRAINPGGLSSLYLRARLGACVKLTLKMGKEQGDEREGQSQTWGQNWVLLRLEETDGWNQAFQTHRFSLMDTYLLQSHTLPQKVTGQWRGAHESRATNSQCSNLGSLEAANAMSRRTVNRTHTRLTMEDGPEMKTTIPNPNCNTSQFSILLLDPHLWPWPSHYPQRNKVLDTVNFALLTAMLESPSGAIFSSQN